MRNLIINNHSILVFEGNTLIEQIKQTDVFAAKKKGSVLKIERSNYENFVIDFAVVKTINEKSFDAAITSSLTFGTLVVQPTLTAEAFFEELETLSIFPIMNGTSPSGGGSVNAASIASALSFTSSVPVAVGTFNGETLYEAYITLPNSTALRTSVALNASLNIKNVLEAKIISNGSGIVRDFADSNSIEYYVDPTNDPANPNKIYLISNGNVAGYHNPAGLAFTNAGLTTPLTDAYGQINLNRTRTWSINPDSSEVASGTLRILNAGTFNVPSMPEGFVCDSRIAYVKFTQLLPNPGQQNIQVGTEPR